MVSYISKRIVFLFLLILTISCAPIYTYTFTNVDTKEIHTNWSRIPYEVGDTVIMIPSGKKFYILERHEY